MFARTSGNNISAHCQRHSQVAHRFSVKHNDLSTAAANRALRLPHEWCWRAGDGLVAGVRPLSAALRFDFDRGRRADSRFSAIIR